MTFFCGMGMNTKSNCVGYVHALPKRLLHGLAATLCGALLDKFIWPMEWAIFNTILPSVISIILIGITAGLLFYAGWTFSVLITNSLEKIGLPETTRKLILLALPACYIVLSLSLAALLSASVGLRGSDRCFHLIIEGNFPGSGAAELGAAFFFLLLMLIPEAERVLPIIISLTVAAEPASRKIDQLQKAGDSTLLNLMPAWPCWSGFSTGQALFCVVLLTAIYIFIRRFGSRISLAKLSRSRRAIIAATIAWSLYVTVRTSDSYEILGYNLYGWNKDYFWINLLIPPLSIGGLYLALQWIKKGDRT